MIYHSNVEKFTIKRESQEQSMMHIREPAVNVWDPWKKQEIPPRGAQWDRCHKSVCTASPHGKKCSSEDPKRCPNSLK